VCSSLSRKSAFLDGEYVTIVTICCHNTDHFHVNEHDRTILVTLATYCTKLPDDRSSVIRNVLEYS